MSRKQLTPKSIEILEEAGHDTASRLWKLRDRVYEYAFSEETRVIPLIATQYGSISDPQALADYAMFNIDMADRIFEPYKAKLAAKGTIPECKKGCSFCCTVPVTLTVPELLIAFHWYRAKHSKKAFGRLKQRNKAAMIKIRQGGKVPRVTLQVQCSFLEGGECSIYPVRPLACRGYNSLDVTACEAGRDNTHNIPIEGIQYAVYDGVNGAMIKPFVPKMREIFPIVELQSGLEVLIKNKRAIKEWVEGKKPFPYPGEMIFSDEGEPDPGHDMFPHLPTVENLGRNV